VQQPALGVEASVNDHFIENLPLNVAVQKFKHWPIISSSVPDFSYGYSKSGIQIRPFFRNPTKPVSGHIGSRICRMPVQLQCIQ